MNVSTTKKCPNLDQDDPQAYLSCIFYNHSSPISVSNPANIQKQTERIRRISSGSAEVLSEYITIICKLMYKEKKDFFLLHTT